MADALPRTADIGVIGAGAMGAGIAQIAAQAGHRVRLFDNRMGAADQAKAKIAETLKALAAKGKLAPADADAAAARIVPVHALGDFVSAALVIEAIVEDLDVKRKLLRELEVVVAPDAILATNTSSLSITALAAGLKHPARVVGMHFFNPAPVLPLVEVVSGLATGTGVAEAVYATAAAWGKVPVHATSTPGFIVNRCARAFYSEALGLLWERAADPATIDAVMREAGAFRMGPFELMDMIGNDVNFAVTKSVWEAYFHDPRFRPSVLQQERVAAGHLGRKSGRGYFDYAEGAAKPLPRTEGPAPRPSRVALAGGSALAEGLAGRLRAAGFDVGAAAADAAVAPSYLEIDGALLVPCDGRTATAIAVASGRSDVVVFDLAFDYAKCTRLALAAADGCGAAAVASAVGALQAAGVAASRFDDVAGLPVMRTVAMLANEAADAVTQGIASARDVDLAMMRGVNYPRGPLAWADAIGVAHVRTTLGHLAAHYGEDRYRLSPLIARRGATGARLGSDPMHDDAPPLTPAEAQALAERVAAGMYARDNASQGLGIRIARVAPGFAELSMVVRADMVNGHAITHGGLVFTLADSAFAYACNSYNVNTVAAGCAIEFLAPSREGDVLTATAREHTLVGRNGIYDIDVKNQNGETIALFRGKSTRIRGNVV